MLAVLNEIVWRKFSTDAWVNFKVFGFLPLTLIFAAAQFPLLQKYAVPETGREQVIRGAASRPAGATSCRRGRPCR